MTLPEVILFGVDVIARVTRAVLEANEGTITPEQALERIAEAGRQDAAVDAKADAALDAKFPVPPKENP